MANMKEIRELRERTGAGVLDCKKALEEKNGDLEEAVEFLREKGIAAASKRAGKVASEGRVNILINDEKQKGVIVELNSETDFVAKNDQFNNLIEKMSEHLLKSNAENLDDVLSEKWCFDNDKDVNTILKEAIANIGENLKLRRFKRIETDGFLQDYLHLGGKIGVMLDVNADLNEENQKAANNIAMHIAASSPEYINRESVSKEVIEKERVIYKEQMLNAGKPEHIIDNIVDGKMNKFYSQICLLEQEYVRDTDITVQEYLDNSNIEINSFVRFELGEGIEKKEEDFAEEVMKEMKK